VVAVGDARPRLALEQPAGRVVRVLDRLADRVGLADHPAGVVVGERAHAQIRVARAHEPTERVVGEHARDLRAVAEPHAHEPPGGVVARLDALAGAVGERAIGHPDAALAVEHHVHGGEVVLLDGALERRVRVHALRAAG
jgi:hypothetical protein